MIEVDRSLWHRRTQRGGMAPAVAGARKSERIACSFCAKTFGSETAVRQHEQMYHRKLLQKLLEQSQ